MICNGLEGINETIWNKVLEIYKKTESSDLIDFLTCVKNETILQSFLEKIARNEIISSKYHRERVFENILEKNFVLVKKYFVDNVNQLKDL